MRRAALLGFVVASGAASALVGCAGTLVSPAYSELEETHTAPATREAATLAPEEYADAERARVTAERLHDDGDDQTAGVEAEHALSLYALAETVARTKIADARETTAIAARDASRAAAEASIAARAKADNEATELDAQLRVATHPVTPKASGPAAHDRELARLHAARALMMDANILCQGAREISGASDPATVSKVTFADEAREVDDVIAKAAAPGAHPAGAAIDSAARHRAHCLSSVTSLRSADAATQADALFVRLSSEAGMTPYRTELGIAVTLESAFDGGALHEAARTAVDRLAAIALERSLPLLLVVHDATGSDAEQIVDGDRAAAAVKAAKADGSRAVVANGVVARDLISIVDPADAAHRARNERLDVILVVR